jgi:hypothetical protein
MVNNMKFKIIKVLSAITIIPIVANFIINQRKKSILRKRVLADGSNNYKETALNIANSISKSKELYKELIVKAHPDKYQDEKKILATELSAKITKAKRNYDELCKLELELKNLLID